jgi:hypothetical protein
VSAPCTGGAGAGGEEGAGSRPRACGLPLKTREPGLWRAGAEFWGVQTMHGGSGRPSEGHSFMHKPGASAVISPFQAKRKLDFLDQPASGGSRARCNCNREPRSSFLLPAGRSLIRHDHRRATVLPAAISDSSLAPVMFEPCPHVRMKRPGRLGGKATVVLSWPD